MLAGKTEHGGEANASQARRPAVVRWTDSSSSVIGRDVSVEGARERTVEREIVELGLLIETSEVYFVVI